MKRVKEKEDKTRKFLEKFVTYGYIIKDDRNNKEYIYWGKIMADVCERAYIITGKTDIYINERYYVKPYNKKSGKQHIRPNWYFGNVYER